MRKVIIAHRTVATLILLAILRWSNAASADSCSIATDLKPKTATILPGQVLDLTLSVRNSTGQTVSVFAPSERIGTVTAGIASETNSTVFRDYVGPGWGIKDVVGRQPTQLGRNSELALQLRVLYQAIRGTDADTELMTPFAFSSAGTFLLGIGFTDELACPSGTPRAFVKVQVVQPTGDDLAVWNAIKDCAACAALLHTGDFDKNIPAERAALATLKDLARQHPKSRYTKFIRKQLDALEQKSHDEDEDRDKNADRKRGRRDRD